MSTCSRCGASFSCGMVDDTSGTPCWCTQLPILPAAALVTGADGAGACFCPACLRALIAASTLPSQAPA